MLEKLINWAAWAYWHANRPFVAAFTEALFGYGEGDLKVEGRVIVRKITSWRCCLSMDRRRTPDQRSNDFLSNSGTD
jgi:hypothetical protein